jgi:SEC-C motif-containing protein
MHNPTALCPCQSSQPYQSCCLPLHKQHKRPDTAEQLMRSRYSAFYLKLTDYLVQTLHPDFKKTDDVSALTRIFETTQWLGLKILNHSQSSLHSAQVEFVAFYQEHHTKEIQQLHENSRFSMIEHQWLYQDGEQLSAIKLARNEACFCGSGTKLKKCHSS